MLTSINLKLRPPIGWAPLLTVCLLSYALSGCGGNSVTQAGGIASNRTGSASLLIDWTQPQSRLIPTASNSIRVSFVNGLNEVSSQTVVRPTIGSTSTVSFTGLPSSDLTLTASAYPSNTGTGVIQATASKVVTIVAGQSSSVAITMNSTVAALSLVPLSVTVQTGASTTLRTTALNSSGSVVMIDSANLSFESSDSSVAAVSSGGTVTGIKAGTSTIKVTELESGRTASIVATVNGVGGGVVTVD